MSLTELPANKPKQLNYAYNNITSFKIAFGSNFGNKIRVQIWIIHELLYEIDTHIEYLKLKF